MKLKRYKMSRRKFIYKYFATCDEMIIPKEWCDGLLETISTKDKEECKCYGVSLEGICTRCDKPKPEDKQEEIEFEDIKDIEESIVHLWFGKKINKLIMNQKKIIKKLLKIQNNYD